MRLSGSGLRAALRMSARMSDGFASFTAAFVSYTPSHGHPGRLCSCLGNKAETNVCFSREGTETLPVSHACGQLSQRALGHTKWSRLIAARAKRQPAPRTSRETQDGGKGPQLAKTTADKPGSRVRCAASGDVPAILLGGFPSDASSSEAEVKDRPLQSSN